MPRCFSVVSVWYSIPSKLRSAREDECGLGVDWADARNRCWRCGREARLELCHIVPASRDGLRKSSNLVLLCKRCHKEAMNVSDP
jgi:5-methylcytosine-specific restriction endonuclease McrA